MGSRSDWYCWEIVQCKKSKNCPARKNPHKPCWEIVKELDNDYRSFFNVCQDCIVHVLKTGEPALSNGEIMGILKSRSQCRLSPRYSERRPRPGKVVSLSPG